MTVAVRQRTSDESQESAEEQHRRDDLAKQWHTYTQVTCYGGKERRRGDERNGGQKRADAQRR